MFQEMCGLVGQVMSGIGWGEDNGDETSNNATAVTKNNEASNPDNDDDKGAENDEAKISSSSEQPEIIESWTFPEGEETMPLQAGYDAAALQVPAVTTNDDTGDAGVTQEAQHPSTTLEPATVESSSASTLPQSAQELPRGDRLPDPLRLPPASRSASSPPRSSLGSNSAHRGHVGRTTSSTPPRSSSNQHRRTNSNTELSYGGMMAMATADHLHASWTNMTYDPEDSLSFVPAAGFASGGTDGSLGGSGSSRPLPVSRISSNASTVSTSGPALVSSNSFGGEDYYYHGISSGIHDAARITDWETVKNLCARDPEAAKFVGKDGWTALHHACNRRCPDIDVFKALLQAYPNALLLEEEKGWYPLHFACRFKTPKEAVRLLVHMFPDKGTMAVKKADRQGRTSLYYAVRYDAPPGVVEILLNVDASVVLDEDQSGDSPLGLVWDSWAEKLEGKRTIQKILGTHSENENLEEHAARVQKRLQSQSKVVERWNNVNKFLKAAFGFSVQGSEERANNGESDDEEKKDSPISNVDGRKWRILHATAAIKCHPTLFQLACALHPEQVFELDDDDLRGPPNISGGWQTAKNLTVLHLAASSQASGDNGRAVLQKLLELNPSAVQAKDSLGNLPLHRIAENKAKTHWTRDGAKDIHDAYVDAVRAPDADGRLPLHRAATAMIPQGEGTAETTTLRSTICNLLELYPDGAAHSDNFGRLPLHVAAEHGTAWDIQLQLLHDQFPEAVRSRTGVKLGNQLPLHMAASNACAEPSLIKKLLEFHPRAASQANRGGKLPLHFACETGLSWESVHAILEANPDAIRQAEQNSRGWNPLQMASACKCADKELVANLLEVYPEAAQVADTRRRYALHLACISGKSWEGGLSDLFDGNPEAISSPDVLGLLPFFIACFRYCESTTVPSPDESSTMAAASPGTPQKHHRRTSSRVSTEVIQREQAREAEEARQTDIIFNLLKADPSVLQA